MKSSFALQAQAADATPVDVSTPAAATITVNFEQYTTFSSPDEATNVYAFMITPLRLSLPAEPAGTTYDVTLNLVSNVNGAKISKVDIISAEPPDYTFTELPSGSAKVSFESQTSETDSFHYEVTVEIPGGLADQPLAPLHFVSRDPEMQIPPPNG